VYNVGSQKERTVLDVARDVAAIFSLPGGKIVHVRDRAFNDRRYYICDSKLAALGAPPPRAAEPRRPLAAAGPRPRAHARARPHSDRAGAAGWRERTSWESGLRQTVDWYLTHGFKDYWDRADVEAALAPHPIIHPQTLLALGSPTL